MTSRKMSVLSVLCLPLLCAAMIPPVRIARGSVEAMVPPDCARGGPMMICFLTPSCSSFPTRVCHDASAGDPLPGSPWQCWDPNNDDCWCCVL